MIFTCASRLNRAGALLFTLAAVGLACAMSAATAHSAEAATTSASGHGGVSYGPIIAGTLLIALKVGMSVRRRRAAS